MKPIFSIRNIMFQFKHARQKLYLLIKSGFNLIFKDY